MKKLPLLLVVLALVAGAAASLGGCSSTIENRDPLGEAFPSVEAVLVETVEAALVKAVLGLARAHAARASGGARAGHSDGDSSAPGDIM